MQTIQIKLAHEIPLDANPFNVLELRPLCGYDESFLHELEQRGLPDFQIIHSLLERLVVTSNNSSALYKLTIGDRASIVLQLRQVMFGNNISGSTYCPFCNGRLSFDFLITDFLRNYHVKEQDTISINSTEITIRALTIEDQNTVLNMGNQPEREVAKRCIISKHKPNLSKKMLSQISNILEKMDPLADSTLNLHCPDCHKTFDYPFNVEGFFLQEIASFANLDNEIHLLALNYHWELDTLLSLPFHERKKYCALISESLSSGD